MLIVDDVLTNRMVQIEIDNLVSRIGAYPGVVIEHFGSAVAFVSPRVPERFFSSVQGTSEATLEHLDEIERLYATHGLCPSLEIVPSRLSERLGMELGRRGYAMVQFHAGLVARPTLRPASTAVIVQEVGCDETFVELYLACWEECPTRDVRDAMMQWQNNACWRFFVAHADSKVAGAAILDTRDKTALLGSAGTLPAYRGRGLQRALIDRRITEAAQAGCDLVVGGAYFGTSSMRNQQRAGLALAFTRGIWVTSRPGR